MSLNEFMKKALVLKPQSFEKKLKVALLSSFTVKGLLETISVKCSDLNIGCTTFEGGYNQYSQDILDSDSNYHKFNADLTYLAIDTRTLLGELFFSPYKISEKERRIFIEKKINDINNLIKTCQLHSNSKIIIFNCKLPTYSPYGINETKQKYGLHEMIYDFNCKLSKLSSNNPSIFIYDFQGFVSKFGEKNIFDYRQFFYGDIQIKFEYIPQLADELIAYVIPIFGLNRKCIVLDLDNTLWGGIIGEDNFSGIKLGSKYPGNTFVEFQHHLLALHNRGIILAINSKNNFEDAFKVIREHPDMILREKNFACIKINWQDKVSNLKEIAKEINIGLDSLVFFDDDPVNCEFVKKALPMVKTINLPKDPSFYSQILMSIPDFNLYQITKEDELRGKMYYEEHQRNDLKNQVTSLDEFLNELDIKIKIREANDFTIPRISQLTLKTNQFNLTTNRYQEEQIKEFKENKNFLVVSAEVQDKFGDNGITGSFIIKKINSKIWEIDTFLLSCRVMGRKVEETMMSYIINKAKEECIEKIYAKYIPTQKNQPCSNFLNDFGFEKYEDKWIYSTEKPFKFPKNTELI